MQGFYGTGRLCDSPATSQKEGKKKVSTFTLAFPRDFKREGGEIDSDFLRCVCFGNQAEFAEKYLRKGMRVNIKGQIQTETYVKDGIKMNRVRILASYLSFANTKEVNEKYMLKSEQADGEFIDVCEPPFEMDTDSIGEE